MQALHICSPKPELWEDSSKLDVEKNNRINIANADLLQPGSLVSSFAKNQEEILHTSSTSIKKEAFARPGLHYLPCSTMKFLPVCPRERWHFFPQ